MTDIVHFLKELTGIGLPPSSLAIIWVYLKLDKRLTHIEHTFGKKKKKKTNKKDA